jgi:GNAT superfamily N-acetyltransferase
MSDLRPLSALSAEERDGILRFLGEDGVLPLYFETAIEDLARGIDNRLVLIGRERRGLILGIAFADLEAFTVIGGLDDAELGLIWMRSMPAELHVSADIAERVRPRLGGRLIAEHVMRVETCTIGTRTVDSLCRTMIPADAERLAAFYRAHNPRSVFSPWMLDHPFIAIEEAGEIVAGAGVLALSRRLGWALIGNFLTRPDRHGRGLARRIGETLLAALGRNGAALVTTDDNNAARSVYRTLGFSLAEAMVQLDLNQTNHLN